MNNATTYDTFRSHFAKDSSKSHRIKNIFIEKLERTYRCRMRQQIVRFFVRATGTSRKKYWTQTNVSVYSFELTRLRFGFWCSTNKNSFRRPFRLWRSSIQPTKFLCPRGGRPGECHAITDTLRTEFYRNHTVGLSFVYIFSWPVQQSVWIIKIKTV